MVVITTLIGALIFVLLGINKLYHGIAFVISEGTFRGMGIELVHTLDNFLFALVFLIFAFGFSQLFLQSNIAWLQKIQVRGLQVSSLKELKNMLWSTSLLTLMINFASNLISGEYQLEWTVLIYPFSIALLAGAYKLLH